MENEIKTNATNNFKLAVVILLFFITGFHILEIICFPYQKIVSDRVLLGVALMLLGYLWVQEMKDREVLQKNYTELVAVQSKLQQTNLEVIRSLALAEEAKDFYTRGHSTRIAKCSLLIAKKLGFSKKELRVLENACILHDIGKIGIADEILQKKGKLDSGEWDIIKEHPNKAMEILSPLEFLSREKEIIKHHHERYDGRGYPDGINGDEIPIGSRIMAAVDSFDAMRSKRPYRDPLPKETVISELKANAGAQFDPKIVNILLQIIEKGEDIL